MRRLALPLALCVGLSTGCGGNDDEGRKGRSVTVQAGAAARVVGREYFFDPSTIVVRGAGALTLTLDNRGALAHDLRVVRGDREIGGTPTFQGGRTRSATVRLERGAYELICTVGNHADLGMKGKLDVR